MHQGLQDQDVAGGTGVDDAGTGQRGQLRGRGVQGLARSDEGGGGDVVQAGAGVGGRLLRRGGGLGGDGQDGALDRAGDARPRQVAGPAQGAGQGPAVQALPTVRLLADDLTQPPHELAEDHPRVATGREQRGAGQAVGVARQVGRAAGRRLPGVAADGVERGVQGEVEVGAGVAVRDGEDVEGVDLAASRGEHRAGGQGPAPGRERVESLEAMLPLVVLAHVRHHRHLLVSLR